MARVQKAKKSTDVEAGTVTFEFADGVGTLVVRAGDMPQEMQRHLILHGISQKLGDSYSGVDTAAEARAEAERVVKDLSEGIWAQRSAAGAGLSDFVEALARLTSKPQEDVRKFIESITEEQVAALKKDANVKAVVMAIKAERAQAAVGGKPSLDLGAVTAAAAAPTAGPAPEAPAQ